MKSILLRCQKAELFLHCAETNFSSTFSKIFFVVALLALGQGASNAQSSANYTFSTNATSSLALDLNSNAIDMSTGTTTLLASSIDDTRSSLTNIGFDFYFMGSRITNFSCTENGIIELGGNAVATNTYLISANTTLKLLGVFANDLRVGTDGKVHYKVVGTAPNRTLVIEYQNIMVRYLSTAEAGGGTWQARIYESSGIVEYVYGAMNTNTATQSSVNVGFGTNTTANTFVTVNTSHISNTSGTFASFTPSSSSTVTHLHSTSNGTRRAYVFTPPIPTAPTSLSFTSVTGTGMTLNWTDNASNELGYAIYRSTDNVTFTYVASTAANAVSYAATGLSFSTLYYWKVYAFTEGGVSSALSGSQMTSDAPVYYWVGTTGGDWNTAANWNTAADNTGATRSSPATSDILIIDGAGTTPGGAVTISISAAQSIGALRVSSGTDVTLQSSSATTRTITMTGSTGDELDIPNGNSLILNNATNAAALAFSTGSGMTGNISGVLTFGGSTSNTFTTTGGTGTVVTVSSTGIVNLGTTTNAIVSTAATLMFANNSTCNSTGATSGAPAVPLATWGASSNLNISGLTTSTTAPTNNVQSFGNITFNCPGLTSTYNFWGSSNNSIQGSLTVSGTSTGKFRCVSTATLTVGGNLVVSGAANCDIASGTGTVNVTGNFTHSSSGTTIIGAGSTGILNVTGTFTQSAGTVDLSSSSSNGTVKVAGTFNQSGGTITESSTSTGSIIEFNGTIAQDVTIGATTNTVNYKISNNAGINLAGTMAITTGASLTISSTASSPVTGAGTITYTGTTTLVYNSASGAQTVTSAVFPSASGPSNFTVNNTATAPNNVVSFPLDRSVSGTLTMTAGDINTGANTLTLGTGTGVTGTLSLTSGVIIGNFKRWIGTTTGARDFPVGVAATQRKATINFTAAPTAGGTLTASFVSSAPGITGLPLTEGSINVNTAGSTGYWKVDAADGLTGGTYTGTFVATGFAGVSAFASLVLIKRPTSGSWALNGTHVTTTGSNAAPVLSRSGMTGFSDFGVGGDAAVNPLGLSIISIITGNWGDGSTWNTGTVPTAYDVVTIATGHNVTLASGTPPYAGYSLTINSGGTLTANANTLNLTSNIANSGTVSIGGGTISITGASTTGVTNSGTFLMSSGSVTVGPTGGGNRTFASTGGSLTISSGTININGNFTVSGGAFTQSGGTIAIDGNSGTAATSTATGVALCSFSTSGVLNLNAGTIKIIDPPHNSYAAGSTRSLSISRSQDLTGISGTHTFEFGDGSSTETGNSNGFVVDDNLSARNLLQNVVVNAGSATGRWLSGAYAGANFGMHIKGSLTINSGSEVRIFTTGTAGEFAVGGNIVNDGTFSANGTLTLGGISGTYSVSTPQSISGSGVFRNSTSAPTASFTNVVVNNSGGITLSTGANLSISGILTLTSGLVTTTSTNLLTINNTASGGVTGGSATTYVNGPLARVLPASLVSGSTYTFPTGKGSYNLFELVNPTTTAGGTVTIVAEVFDANAGGTAGSNLQSLNTNRYWNAAFSSGSANFTNTTIRLTETGLTSTNRIGQSATLAGTYNSIGGSVSGSTILSNAIATLDNFVIGTTGPIAGAYTVCPAGCDFPGLTTAGGAFAEINSRTVIGNVTLSITNDLSGENGLNALNQWTESGAGNYTLTIQPSGGATRTVTGSASSAMIKLNGADRVTIDGLNSGSNALVFSNTNASGATIQFINDASNNTVQNCTIQGIVTSSTTGVVSISTGTTTGNDNITISNNLIRDGASAPLNGIYASGTAGATNNNITITNNSIFNWTSFGISASATGNGDNWNISNNSFYQTASRTSALTGISFLTGSNANTINNNSIGGADASRGGTALTTTGNFFGMNVSVGTTTATEIQGNVFGNIVSSTVSSDNYAIQINGGNLNIGTTTGNTIGGTAASDMVFSNTFDGIINNSTGVVDIENNTVRNIKYDNGDWERLTGINITAGTATVKNNVIRDLIHKGTTTTTNPSLYSPIGIRLGNTTANNLVEGNSIYNISLDYNGANSSTFYPMYGIIVAGAVSNTTITRNKIYNLTTTRVGTTSSAPFIYGIFAYAGAATYSNNQISLTQSTGSTQPLFRGIQLESTGNNNFYYNSVYIGGTAAAANNTFGFYRSSTSGTQTLRNNLLYNERAGTGNHFAIGTASTTGWTSSVTSDYSTYISANASNIGYWGGTANTFATWKSNTSGDKYSHADVNTNAPSANMFIATATGDLNINTGNIEAWYVAGKGVQIAGITADYGSTTASRPVTVPQGATDIGSDEIDTPSVDPHVATASTPPSVGVTTTYSFAGRVLTSITWGAGGTPPSAITLKYYSGETPPDATCSNPSALYADAWWDVQPTGGTGFTYDMIMGYTPAILGTIPTETDSRLSENETNCWKNYPNSTVNVTSKTVTQVGLTDFSKWTLSSINAPLPIELKSIHAFAVDASNIVEWTTLSEANAEAFIVERSADGISFRDLGTVAATGFSTTAKSYDFEDTDPFKVSYYRLRMLDIDGFFKYSPTVVVTRATGNFGILTAYPNPTTDRVNIEVEMLEEGDVNLIITDLTGRIVLVSPFSAVKGLNIFQADLSNLPAGVYQVNGRFDGITSKPYRIVKQ